MMTAGRALVGVLLIALGRGAAFPQDAAPALTILEPGEESYLVDAVRLRAAIEPEDGADGVESVEFFVDGERVCTVSTPPFQCDWNAGSDVRARVVRVVARLGERRLVASVRTRALPDIEEVTGASAVLVPVVVRDRNNRFVNDLTRDDFRIFENGVQQEILLCQTGTEIDSIPLSLVLAVDISISMADSFGELKNAVKRFVAGMTGANVSLVAFNDRIYVPMRNEDDVDRVMDVVDALPSPFGTTSLLDALDVALDLHGDVLFRKAVIVVTDGADTASLAAVSHVERKIRENQTTIYVITRGEESAGMLQAQELLGRLTQASGGRAFLIDDMDRLDGFLQYIREELRSQYFITYRPSNPELDGTWRRIDVRTTGRGHRIRAREGYLAEPLF